ncbi:MAG: flagellar hook-basal body protein FliE [Hyphomicrobiaceae bacterium]|nr:MAG: flagellar hook-basal body protein FliE [Hyphomicrobiaceae bacterium]
MADSASLSPLNSPSAASSKNAGTADFTALFNDMVTNAVGVLKGAEAVAVAGVQGQVPVQQVVEAVMAAEQTLQGALAVRDKVVAAYLELSRMSI